MPGTTYEYKLRALGHNGEESFVSNTGSHSTTISAPTGLSETILARTTTSFQANWSSVPRVTEYILTVSEHDDENSILSNTVVTGISEVISNLTPGKYYDYWVLSKGTDIDSDK